MARYKLAVVYEFESQDDKEAGERAWMIAQLAKPLVTSTKTQLGRVKTQDVKSSADTPKKT